MKKDLTSTKKLLQYAASATAFLAINQAGATVVYTDLDPDLAIGGEGAEASIDINEDGTDDFTFSIYNFSGSGTYSGFSFGYVVNIALGSALNGNEFLGSIVSYSGYSGVYAPILPAGTLVGSDDNFANGAMSMAVSASVTVLGFPYYTYVGGNWLDTDMAFMGFRINIDKDRYYGWMRVSVSDDATMITIHDYAYQSEPNTAIFVGQTATEIEENPLSNAQIFSNGGNIVVDIPSDFTGTADLQLFDMNGKLVKSMSGLSGHNVLDCNDLASGNYAVRLGNAELTVKKQLNLSI